LAEENDTQKLPELKNSGQREKQRNQVRRVQQMRGKFKSRKVTTMYRTREIDGAQAREECTTQNQMNKTTVTENEARFSRARQGAFMQPELRVMYGNLGNLEPATTQTLQGTIEILSTLDFYAKLMIQAMKIPEGVPTLTTKDMAWNREEFKQSWGKQNTQTSCELSQLPESRTISLVFRHESRTPAHS